MFPAATEQFCCHNVITTLVSRQVLALAMAYQSITTEHLMRPPINEVEPEIVAECLQYSRCGQAETYNSTETINSTYISESG